MFARYRSAVCLTTALMVMLVAPARAQVDELPAPAVTTLAATDITETTATFHAKVATNNTATTGQFVYGRSLNRLTARTPAVLLSAGPGEVALDAPLSGLTPGTTYYFRAVVENEDGTVSGDTLSFSTGRRPQPAILGGSVTDITYRSATLYLNIATRGETVSLSGCIRSGVRTTLGSICVSTRPAAS